MEKELYAIETFVGRSRVPEQGFASYQVCKYIVVDRKWLIALGDLAFTAANNYRSTCVLNEGLFSM
jgi:hypothetical protein